MSIAFASPETTDIVIDTEPADSESLQTVAEAAIERPGVVLPGLVDEIFSKFPNRIVENEETHVQTLSFMGTGNSRDTAISRTLPDENGDYKVSIYAVGNGSPGIKLKIDTATPEVCDTWPDLYAHRKQGYGEPERAIPVVLRSLDRSIEKYEAQKDLSARVGSRAIQLIKPL